MSLPCAAIPFPQTTSPSFPQISLQSLKTSGLLIHTSGFLAHSPHLKFMSLFYAAYPSPQTTLTDAEYTGLSPHTDTSKHSPLPLLLRPLHRRLPLPLHPVLLPPLPLVCTTWCNPPSLSSTPPPPLCSLSLSYLSLPTPYLLIPAEGQLIPRGGPC